jgi:hypothetical protein
MQRYGDLVSRHIHYPLDHDDVGGAAGVYVYYKLCAAHCGDCRRSFDLKMMSQAGRGLSAIVGPTQSLSKDDSFDSAILPGIDPGDGDLCLGLQASYTPVRESHLSPAAGPGADTISHADRRSAPDGLPGRAAGRAGGEDIDRAVGPAQGGGDG